MLNTAVNQSNYDPRWFIWTIVFLIVTGISLASYLTVEGIKASTEASSISAVPHYTKPNLVGK